MTGGPGETQVTNQTPLFQIEAAPNPVRFPWTSKQLFASSNLPVNSSTIGIDLPKVKYECKGCNGTYHWEAKEYYAPAGILVSKRRIKATMLDSGIALYKDNTLLGEFKIYVFDMIEGNCEPVGEDGCRSIMGCIAAVQLDFSPRAGGFIYSNYYVTLQEKGNRAKNIGGASSRLLYYDGHGLPCDSYPDDAVAIYSLYDTNISRVHPIRTYSLFMDCSKCVKK